MCYSISAALDSMQIASISYIRQKSFEICGIRPRSPLRATCRNEVNYDSDNSHISSGKSFGKGSVSATIIIKIKRNILEENEYLETVNKK